MTARNPATPASTLEALFASWVRCACAGCDCAAWATESFCSFYRENAPDCERALNLILRAEGHAEVEAGAGKILQGGWGTDSPHVVRVRIVPLYTVEVRFTVCEEGGLWCTLAIEETDRSGDQRLYLPRMRFKVGDAEDYLLT